MSRLFHSTRRPPNSPLFPYTTLFRSKQPYDPAEAARMTSMQARHFVELARDTASKAGQGAVVCSPYDAEDRKSTRLNSSHRCISYAVFCLKKKKTSSKNTRPKSP